VENAVWIIGLILGGILGAVIDEDVILPLAAIGGLVGLAIRVAITRSDTEKWRLDVEGRFDHIYRSLEDIHHRLVRLEQSGSVAVPVAVAAPPAEESSPAPAPLVDGTGAADSADLASTPPSETPARASAPEPVWQPAPSIDTTPEPVVQRSAPSLADAPRPDADKPDIISAGVRWLFGGNTVVRVGALVLFFGLAFLVKYAADHAFLPIELRLSGVALAAIVLLVVGWRLRDKRSGYALTLQGTAVALLYLTVFGAYRLYHLVPGGFAFTALVLIAAAAAVLAVVQNSLALAVVGAAGGFLAPILASTGGGSHVMLFSYYAVLNLGILAVAWFKAWRLLNLTGFLFTFIIGLAWGAKFYRPEYLDSTEPFLVFFFLLYVAVAVIFARVAAAAGGRYVDGTIVFGNPAVAFGLQYALVRDVEFGLAGSALAIGGLYLALASALWRRAQESLRLLAESFLALGVVFATLAIPFALDDRWTAAAWALEGAAVVWVGIRQDARLARWFGMLLQVGAGGFFLHGLDVPFSAAPMSDARFLGAMLIAVAGVVSARLLHRGEVIVGATERNIGTAFLYWGIAWWFGGFADQIERHIESQQRLDALLLLLAVSALLLSILMRRLEWRSAAHPLAGGLVVLAGLGLMHALTQDHPFAQHGYLSWPIAFGVALVLLRRHDDDFPEQVPWHHGLWFLLLTWVASAEVGWVIYEAVGRGGSWRLAMAGMVPALIVLGALYGGRLVPWPLLRYAQTYCVSAGLVCIYLWLWMLYANAHSDGNPAPLGYLPIINPLDVAMIAGLLALLGWFRAARDFPSLQERVPDSLLAVSAGTAAFVWLTAGLLRTLHHWAGVDFTWVAMSHSVLAQAALSLFWAALAVGLMLFATRSGRRVVWITGAVLMGVVVVKLFLADLSHLSGLYRVGAFIGVGVLLLLLGYFSPLPPQRQQTEA
jgi:uncharacterized membrane protein